MIMTEIWTENGKELAKIIDVGEFPFLAQKYAVMGVPKTVINEKIEFVGVLSENLFAELWFSQLTKQIYL